MLRLTVNEILKSKSLTKRTCVQAVNALHSKFHPRLTWIEKVTLIKKISDYKFLKSKTVWNHERLSEYVELSYFHVLDSLRLADGLKMYPNLKYVKNRVIASQILRSEFPANEIDGYMYKNNIHKDSFNVSE